VGQTPVGRLVGSSGFGGGCLARDVETQGGCGCRGGDAVPVGRRTMMLHFLSTRRLSCGALCVDRGGAVPQTS
jgi:hypothetical protein